MLKLRRHIQPEFIVGLGASAGGLEALKSFFGVAPVNSGMAFVVVTHRDPKSQNLLPEILGKFTTMPVLEAVDGIKIKPDHVYISPATHSLSLRKGTLAFEPMVRDGAPLPIDYFFRSLAGEQGGNAVGVLLSGGGSDGTLGMQAIKGEGGMVMAQDADSAQHKDLPGNAVATGLVDYVLPPQDMPKQLTEYIGSLSATTKNESSLISSGALDEILALIRQQMGSDFSLYKMNTLRRRIERRMNVHHITDPVAYVQFMKDNPHETALLFKELLIGVTAFFRDPEIFAVLEREILPDLLKGKVDGDTVRFWSAGCSTGEEPLSFAILLQEYMERHKIQFNVQIFATDLDENAITIARTGLYSDGIALDLTPERLEKYFIKEDSHYRVRKNIREMVIFATQNLIQDPPFTKLDLVSCRNLLIYLDAAMQKKILPIFHYALRPGGVLFLGSSETIGNFTDLFQSLNVRGKLFKRRENILSEKTFTRFLERPRVTGQKTEKTMTIHKANEGAIADLAQKLIWSQHVPPTLIVNDKGDIFYVHGKTGPYLELSSGQPQPHQNILDMAREGLRLPLTALLRKAVISDTEIVHSGIIMNDANNATVRLRAQKISDPEALRGLIWIAFEKEEAASSQTTSVSMIGDQQLEQELMLIKRNLQNTIEEHEATNEQLKSTNEELQSTNEELQSANEELETAKEEMQSLNEELQTVNVELEHKIRDLSHANDDMKNLLNGTGIATIFLDNDLNIKRFTAPTAEIIHLIPTDIGRPVRDIVTQLEYSDLVRDAGEVIKTLHYKEMEVRARDWSWYLMRIMPYRTAENVIDGLVITFVNISKLKKSEILLATNIRAIEMMSTGKDPREIIEEILQMIERQATGLWCAISLLDPDGVRMYDAIGPSLPRSFNDELDNIEVRPDATEPCALAALRKDHVVISNISEVKNNSFAERASKYNIRAAWSQPILSSEKNVLGVFTIYYQYPHQPSRMEEDLINQLIPLMGTAISRRP